MISSSGLFKQFLNHSHSHGVDPPVPMVEIADEADAHRIGRPDCEPHAPNPMKYPEVRTEQAVEFIVAPLVVEEKVHLFYCRQETIRVMGKKAVPMIDPIVIRSDFFFWDIGEEALVVFAFCFDDLSRDFEIDPFRSGPPEADDLARGSLVQAESCVGIVNHSSNIHHRSK